MDLFTLFGTISVRYADAVEEIDKVTESAHGAGKELEGMGESAEEAQDPIEESGESAGKSDEKFSAWSMTLANLAANVITKVADKCMDLAEDVIDLGTDFTATMSEVQAISGATDEEFAQLEQTAREFGAETTFSANDAAQALKYMSLAGWSVEESTSALGGVLDLAAASGMELASASNMVTDYLSAFGMGAEDAAYFADMLAFAQSNSNTTAEQLGEAYRNCAANLNAAGQDVETVTSLLEAMANQGYKGSEAGTALAAIMRDITGAMDDGKIAIGDTSISVMDADGNFRDLTDILTEVEAATNGMGDAERAAAMSATFTADSTRGLNLLLNEGLGSIADYEEALRGADGAASDMAATMNDNLKGDMAAMNSALDELKLKIFEGAESPLRGLVQFATDKVVPMLGGLIDNFDKIAPAIAGVTTALVTCKAAMAITGVVDALVKSFKAYQLANEGATVAQWLLNSAMLANPAVLIVGLIAGLIAAIVVLWNTNEDFRNAVTAAWEAVKTAVSTAISAVSGFLQSAWDFLEGYGAYLYDWIHGVIDSAKNFLQTIADAVSGFFQTVWNAIQAGFLFVVELVKGYIQLVTLPWRFLWENCKDTIIKAWEFIKNAVQRYLTLVRTIFTTAFTAIRDVIVTVFEFIRNLFTTIWDAVSNYFRTKLEFIKNLAVTIFTAIRDTISEKLNAARENVTSILDAVRSTISDKLTSAKNTVTSIFETVRTTIRDKIESARDFVKNAIERIKSFFNFSWSLPKLKLPHFSITGGFSLDPPSVPSFGIDWYAKGGILRQPTVFGFNPSTGRAQAGGEAGAEAVAPIDTLLGFVRTAVQEENAALAGLIERLVNISERYFPMLLASIPRDVVLDSGAVVGELAPAMNEALGEISEDENRRK